MLPTQDKGGYRKFHYKSGEYYHIGHDYNCDIGDECKSIDDGIVIFAGLVNGFGSNGAKGGVVIVQYDGYIALFGHVHSLVKKGQLVKKDEVICKVHEYYSGTNDWTHLHFVIRLGSGIPETKWGYVTFEDLKYYVEPIKFIEMMEHV
jgi:murein DD-endopeptidase MepM/ murein hydrolase activator NlpD